MLVTAAPCAIKGAAFDCLRGCHWEERIHRERGEQFAEEGASPCSRQTPECSWPGDRPSTLSHLLVPVSLLSSELHRRLWSGCNHSQNRAPAILIELFYLIYYFLCVVVRVCFHAWLSYSFSFARPTCSLVGQDPRGPQNPASSLSWSLGSRPPWSCPTSTRPRG